MSLTNPAVHLPGHDTVGSWLRRNLGWMLIGVAVVAAAVLVTFLVLDGDSASTTVREPSITALDHQVSADARLELERSQARDLSITAIDKRAEVSRSGESITAIDHRADSGS